MKIWRALLSELNEGQQSKWSKSFLNESFVSAKKGLRSRKNQAEQEDEMDGGGRRPRSSSGKLPSLCISGVCQTRGHDARDDPSRTESLGGPSAAETCAVIVDKVYDSDPLRKRLRQRGIELICPHKKNRVRRATQDGRALRRYRK